MTFSVSPELQAWFPPVNDDVASRTLPALAVQSFLVEVPVPYTRKNPLIVCEFTLIALSSTKRYIRYTSVRVAAVAVDNIH